LKKSEAIHLEPEYTFQVVDANLKIDLRKEPNYLVKKNRSSSIDLTLHKYTEDEMLQNLMEEIPNTIL
jgi:hypothetical protein